MKLWFVFIVTWFQLLWDRVTDSAYYGCRTEYTYRGTGRSMTEIAWLVAKARCML